MDEDGSEEEWSPRKGSPDKEKGAQGPPREQDPNELLAMIAQACILLQLGCIRLQPGCIELYGCSLYCMRLQPRDRVSAPTGSRTGTSSRLAARQGSCTRARPGAAGCPRPPIRRGTSQWPRCRRCAAPRPAGRCCRSRRGRSRCRCPSRARQRSSTAAPCLQLITVQQRISAAARACWAPGSSGSCPSGLLRSVPRLAAETPQASHKSPGSGQCSALHEAVRTV